MQKKLPYIFMWYASMLCLALALLFFALFIFGKWQFRFGISSGVSTVLFALLYFISRKPLQCEGGYSLIQAITFYNACIRAGCTFSVLYASTEILRSVATKENLDDFTDEQLQKCFTTGAKAVREIRNPLLQAVWKQQRKIKK